MLTKTTNKIKDEEVSFTHKCTLTTIEAFAIDPFGSKIDYEESCMNIPTPLLLFGLIITTVGCLFMGNKKGENGKRDSPGMLLLGILGVVALFIVFRSMDY